MEDRAGSKQNTQLIAGTDEGHATHSRLGRQRAWGHYPGNTVGEGFLREVRAGTWWEKEGGPVGP